MRHDAIFPREAFGLGMRIPHYQSYIDGSADVDFAERLGNSAP